MSKKQTKEEQYRLTFKGLLSLYLQEEKRSEVYNAIELYCRRNGWGIAINENNTLDFVPMVKVEEAK
jgi:penicillin-binding protein-related factor A (putative recombinase)